MPAKNVVVIGTGTMGPGIAEMFALGGCRAVLVGRTADSVELGLARARLAAASLEAAGLISSGCAADAEARLSGSTEFDGAVCGADFVVESIIEDIAVKRECFRRLDAVAPPDAILASNTSGMSITEIASATGRPGRVAGMHWWNPPHLIPLVEVVRGDQTADATVSAVAEIAGGLGKVPVVVQKDVPGFIANRLQYALLREAVSMVEQGVASAEDIDLAMRAGPGLRYAALGPLEVADFIGLDVVKDVMDYLLAAMDPPSEPPALLAGLVGSGKLGAKAGEGFYSYRGRSMEELLRERDARLAALSAISGGARPGKGSAFRQ